MYNIILDQMVREGKSDMRAVTLEEYKNAIERQGEFGWLFVDYIGCPRGAIGRMCAPLEEEVLAMPVIVDVDGGEWIPVNAEALNELVREYKRLKVKGRGMSDL